MTPLPSSVQKPAVGLIIQARMGSTRLAGKVLMPIGKKRLLEHIAMRVLPLCQDGLSYCAQLVIATSILPENERVAGFCREMGISCFRGSENNVLERYVRCAEYYAFEHIVRLTGDNPFVDAEELHKLIVLHLNERADFSTSFEALPIGVGAEVFTSHALNMSFEKATQPHHFEHVDDYLLENMSSIRHCALPPVPEKYFPDVRLTIDTAKDLECARWLVAKAGEYITTQEAIRLCQTLCYA